MNLNETMKASSLSVSSAHQKASDTDNQVDFDKPDFDKEFEQLRTLLLAPEQKTIRQIAVRLLALEKLVKNADSRTIRISEVLAKAIDHGDKQDQKLGLAIRPILEKQFHASARENTEVMAVALFPILGPAVRKLISELISPTTKGKSYLVEQLFLIDNATALPISHVHLDDAQVQDADMVSGMLNVIKSYVNDSFAANEFDGLDHLQVGELSVWIEWGPRASLAAVVRGVAPDSLRDLMKLKIENLHSDHRETLNAFNGDPIDTLVIENSMNNMLDMQAAKENKERLKSAFLKGCVLLSFILMIFYMCYSWYDYNRLRHYVDVLNQEPGITIINSSRKFNGYTVTGLRDPLSIDPLEPLASTTLRADKIKFHWSAVVSLHPEILNRRVKNVLRPPKEVTFEVQGTTLEVYGNVSPSWLNNANTLITSIDGIESIRMPAHTATSKP